MSHSAQPLPILEEIRTSFSEGRRLVIRATPKRAAALVKEALEGIDVRVIDLSNVLTESALEVTVARALGGTDLMRTVLDDVDKSARTKPIALVFIGIDGCSESAEESGIAGRLRGVLQGVHYARVFYSATDNDFLGRVLGSPFGSFFKQAVIVDP